MVETIDLLATPEAFRAWLAHGDPERVVGLRASSRSCPVAAFMRDGLGIRLARANLFTLSRDCRDFSSPDGWMILSPEWARSFIEAVDDAGAPKGEVTAGEALAILERSI